MALTQPSKPYEVPQEAPAPRIEPREIPVEEPAPAVQPAVPEPLPA